MAATFSNILELFENLGFFDIFLPFFLLSLIVYAILEKTKLIKIKNEDDGAIICKILNAIAALIIGYFGLIIPRVVEAVTTISSNLIILILLGVLLLFYLIYPKKVKNK